MKLDLKPYWQRLQPREQRLLQFLAAIIGLLLLYSLILNPFFNAREELRQDVATFSQLQQTVNAAAQQKQRLSGIGAGAVQKRNQDLAQLIRQTTNQQQLAGNLKGMTAKGNDGINVQFSDVSFIAINTWLQSLAQQYGLQVQTLSAHDKGHNGKVDLEVELGY